MPYWPSYEFMTPEARRAFLDWMKGGRKDLACGIGYVFIFFYGLEHRMFLENGGENPQVLVAEVKRLLSIYGGNNSFRGYATKFLTCVRLVAGAPISPPQLSPDIGGTTEIPLNIRLYLGAKLAKSDRIDADDALLWLMSLPEFRLRTPAHRCFERFISLWRVQFGASYPNGFKLAVSSTYLTIKYRAASGAFEAELLGAHSHYRDIAAEPQGFQALRLLAEQCTTELDSFSRLVGRYPDRQNSVEAAMLLPEPIRHAAVTAATHELRRFLRELMGARSTATTQLRDVVIAGGFPIPQSDSLPQSIGDLLGQSFDMLDIAIEPDRRYGGGITHLEDHVVVFAAENGGAIDPTKPTYQSMKNRVEVAALAAAADGEGTEEELRAIIGTIRADGDLTQIERLRLIAYAVTIFKSPPKRGRILRRLANTSETERKSIAAAATAIVGAHEQPDPGEVKFLEKLHRTLKLPAAQVYSDIHRAARQIDGPVPVSTESRVPGVKIPKVLPANIAVPWIPASGIRTDRKRLEAVQRNTEVVSGILSRVFNDEVETLETVSQVPLHPKSSVFDGLDIGHTELIKILETKGEISRPEFENRAKALHLLPAGAIERINDWSFDRFDEPLLEDGDNIVLIAHLRDRLAELRETSQ